MLSLNENNLLTEDYSGDKPLKVKTLLQRADVKNQNGRIYPRDVLESVIKEYNEKFVPDMSFGELDHPDCVSGDCDILTNGGWKNIKDIDSDEEILTLNNDTGQIENHKINKKIDEWYKGKAYHIRGRNIDLVTTPNHRFLLRDRNGDYVYKTAEELYKTKNNKLRIPKKGKWNGKYEEYFILDGIKEFKPHVSRKFKEKHSKDLKIKIEDWFEFMGWYLSEGCCHGTKSRKIRGYCVQISQKHIEKRKILEDLFDRLPFKVNKYESGDGKFDYIINDIRLYNYLYKLGSSPEKYIPIELKQYDSKLLDIMFNSFLLGDGRHIDFFDVDGVSRNRKSVFSTSKRLIDDLHEILLKIGKSGNITEYEPIDRWITDTKIIEEEVDRGNTIELVKKEVKEKRLIKAENSKKQYNLHISTTNDIWLDWRYIDISEIDYDDKVYCVNVPNNNFYIRRKGKSFWTGNSSVVEGKNSSHTIDKIWWEDNEVWGTLHILTNTPSGNIVKAILDHGKTLGVSSRGLGSVEMDETERDTMIVQNDFELLCWDVVTNPSVRGSRLDKISEAVNYELGDNAHYYDKVNELVREIICEMTGKCNIN